ncbi:TetR/AcrR family transcriptional regulator [Pleomorphomonas sp. PLEO]|uniref:TetR/AcrR family transcriptional regulator n=1 Tax=Pleomorphomonas sp. PLEO TaxID=3239306 RepID=UPI00351E953D
MQRPGPDSTASHDGSPYHHGDLRRALIAAGQTLLAEGGPSGVSLREVARAAGVSHNAPYRHFESREALLAAIATDGFERLSDRIAATEANANDIDRLIATGRAYITFAIEVPSLYRLMFSSEVRKAAFPALGAAADRTYAQLTAALPSSPATPRGVTLGAWALVHGFADLLTSGQLSDDLQGKLREEAIDHMLRAYARGAAR